jgi:hypothetical protein
LERISSFERKAVDKALRLLAKRLVRFDFSPASAQIFQCNLGLDLLVRRQLANPHQSSKCAAHLDRRCPPNGHAIVGAGR